MVHSRRSLAHPRHPYIHLGPALALGMTTVTVLVDDPDLPLPPRDREPRLAPPRATPPSAGWFEPDRSPDLSPTSAIVRFLLATAAFLHIAARGAGFGAGSSRADGAPSTATAGPKPGGWFSRLLDLYTSTRGAGMANATFLPSFFGTAVSVSASLGFLIAGGT